MVFEGLVVEIGAHGVQEDRGIQAAQRAKLRAECREGRGKGGVVLRLGKRALQGRSQRLPPILPSFYNFFASNGLSLFLRGMFPAPKTPMSLVPVPVQTPPSAA